MMKLNLCDIFKVKEEQHFWIRTCDDMSKQADLDFFIKNNTLMFISDDKHAYISALNINLIKEIYYTKPVIIKLTENTKAFLKLINKDYKYIARDGVLTLKAFKKEPTRIIFAGDDYWKTEDDDDCEWIIEELLDIDLSFIKWEDEPYKISDLIGDEEYEKQK